jgi:hypothetical protein
VTQSHVADRARTFIRESCLCARLDFKIDDDITEENLRTVSATARYVAGRNAPNRLGDA